jgi:hypothetical protein
MVEIITWERWWTADLPTSCARCKGLNGTLHKRGQGPQPPLHDNCRCERRYDHTEIFDGDVPDRDE